MSIADTYLQDNLREIIDGGMSDFGMKVRAKWDDGTPAHTYKSFSVVNKYDLAVEFPIVTIRRQNFYGAIEEGLWIYQRKSNNIKDFSLHIWDKWADENGSIGKTYGYQAAKVHEYADGKMDQVDRVLKDLKEFPGSRRHIITLYDPHDLKDMSVAPCCWALNFAVADGKLNMILVQRSQDMIVANNWDVINHAALQMMFAQVSGLKPGIFTHIITDAHIYDRHLDMAKTLIERKPYPAPRVLLDPGVKNFYDFTPKSFIIEGYQSYPNTEKLEVAV